VEDTCWTLVEDAAGGNSRARDAFARLYLPVVEAYLGARWRGTPLHSEVDDAAQDVFVDLIRPNGALSRAQRNHGAGGFRPFLYGVARKVALRHEERAGKRHRRETRLDSQAPDPPATDSSPSKVFDTAWAHAIMRAARSRHAKLAGERGEESVENVELLRLRFQEGLPIREIAARWDTDAAAVHRQYRRARKEFAEGLFATVAMHMSGTPSDVKRECARLLELLR
jgi:RNA polymerase sigma factor (sigma-70 family)